MIGITTSSSEAEAGFTWGNLLFLGAVANLVVFAIMVVAFRDLLALTLTILIGVGLALTRLRRVLLGTVWHTHPVSSSQKAGRSISAWQITIFVAHFHD